MKPFIKKIQALVLVNVLILVLMLISINILIIIGFHFSRLKNKYYPQQELDARASLPVYKNVPWAKNYFREEAEMDIEYYSHYSWRRKPYSGETITIDTNGVRYTPKSSYEAKNTPLVVFLGGSTMWGVGCNNESTIPSFIVKHSKGDVRAVNFGEVGFDAYQSYLFLHQNVMKGLKPSLVISYDGVNNKWFQGRKDFSDFYENDIRDAVVKAKIKAEDRLTLKDWFLKPIQIVIEKIKNQSNSAQQQPRLVQLSQQNQIKKATELLESWLATQALCESNNIKFVAVLQPHAFTGSPNVSYLKLDKQLELDLSYYSSVIKLLNSTRYAKLKDHFLDFSGVLNNQAVYIDFCHLSPKGNEIVAAKFYSYIKNINF